MPNPEIVLLMSCLSPLSDPKWIGSDLQPLDPLKEVNYVDGFVYLKSRSGQQMAIPERILEIYLYKTLEAIPSTDILKTPLGTVQLTTDGLSLFIRAECGWAPYTDFKDLI